MQPRRTAAQSAIVTAAICTCDRHALLAEAAESLRAQDLDVQYDILVVDNSADQQRAAVERNRYASPGIRYVIEPRPGLANARNVASALCETPVIAFLDDDAVAAPDWLGRLLEGFERFDGAAAVGGRVDPVWPAPRPRWLPDEMLGALTIVDWGGELRIAGEGEWLAGANVAFDNAALRAIGGFPAYLGRIGNERALLGNEDNEVIRRLREQCHAIVYAPEARVAHRIAPLRLRQGWFRKRAAWQAVSDFLAQPEKSEERRDACWDALAHDTNGLPTAPNDFRALFAECEDAGAFRAQVDSIYQWMTVMLAGDEVPADTGARSSSDEPDTGCASTLSPSSAIIVGITSKDEAPPCGPAGSPAPSR